METLVLLGRAMFGRLWQTDMARAIGVSDRAVRFWVAGTRPVPAEMAARIRTLARERLAALAEAAGGTGH